MPVENPLLKLKDIHLPPPVSYWPPAPGWWILAFLFILVLIFGGLWMLRRYNRRKPKIEALKMLKELQIQFEKAQDELASLRSLSQLLRRSALTFYANEPVASLHGTAWLEFLDKKGKTKEFTQGAGKVLGTELYQQKAKLEIDALFPLVKKWISSPQHYN